RLAPAAHGIETQQRGNDQPDASKAAAEAVGAAAHRPQPAATADVLDLGRIESSILVELHGSPMRSRSREGPLVCSQEQLALLRYEGLEMIWVTSTCACRTENESAGRKHPPFKPRCHREEKGYNCQRRRYEQ